MDKDITFPSILNGVPLFPGEEITYEATQNPVKSDPLDFEVSASGELIDRYIRQEGLGRFSLDSMNNFLDEELPLLIRNMSFQHDDIVYLFELAEIKLPTDKGRTPIYPQGCIDKLKTYANIIAATVTVQRGDELIDKQTFDFFALPCMVGSKYCWTYNKTGDELEAMGGSPNIKGGWFIIDGLMRVLKLQEMLRRNRHFIRIDKKGRLYVNLISDSPITTDSIELYMSIAKPKNDKSVKKIRVTNNYNSFSNLLVMFISRHSTVIPVFSVMRLIMETYYPDLVASLGVQEAILQYLEAFIPQEFRSAFRLKLTPSFVHVSNYSLEELRVQIINDLNIFKTDPKKKRGKKRGIPQIPLDTSAEEIVIKLLDSILTHYDYDTLNYAPATEDEYGNHSAFDHIVNAKFYHLGFLIRELFLASQGIIDTSDIDAWSNKSLRTSDTTLYSKLRKVLYELRNDLYNLTSTREASAIFVSKDIDIMGKGALIGSGIVGAFKNNNWSGRNRGKTTSVENISDVLEFINPTQVLKKITEVAAPVDKKTKAKKGARGIQPDQIRFICPIDSPDNDSNGLVKHMTIACTITDNVLFNEREKLLYTLVVESGLPIDFGATMDNPTPFFFNGRYVGFTEGPNMKAYLREIKLTQYEFRQICVVIENNVLYLESGKDRPSVPYLRVENGKPLLIKDNYDCTCGSKTWDKCKCDQPWKKLTFRQMVESGYVEYLDPWETHFFPDILTASSQMDIDSRVIMHQNLLSRISKLEGRIKEKMNSENTEGLNNDLRVLRIYNSNLEKSYQSTQVTHMDMHESVVASYTVNTLPMIEYGPSPRATFSSSILGGATTATSANNMSFLNGRSLVYPQRPIVDTILGKIIYDKLPYGINLRVAIMPLSGRNQEDSCIVNERLVELGFFDYEVRSSESYTVKESEEVANPIKYGITDLLADPKRYHAISNSTMRKGVISGLPRIGAYIGYGDCILGKVRTINGKKDDVSIFAQANEEGLVEDVIDGGDTIIIKLVQYRRPIAGDKISTRQGQKMTIGEIRRSSLMPHDKNGVPIDIAINPHCMSRMTMGLFLEIMLGIKSQITRTRGNGNNWEGVDILSIMKQLPQYGYELNELTKLIDGATGEEITCPIFVGYCYFLITKHTVYDKIQGRGPSGPIKEFTGLPGGGSKQSGIRFGEQEGLVLGDYGAPAIASEILCHNSDGRRNSTCDVCGWVGDFSRRSIFLCKVCGNNDKSKFSKITTGESLFRFEDIIMEGSVGIKRHIV